MVLFLYDKGLNAIASLLLLFTALPFSIILLIASAVLVYLIVKMNKTTIKLEVK